MSYEFTNDWFSHNISAWQAVLPQRNIKRVLEIGSYEGRSTLWLMENVLPKYGYKDLTCIDVWKDVDVYTRFINNTSKHDMRIDIRYGSSVIELAKLITYKSRPIEADKFDFIYVDGSHIASDVLTDLCLAFELLKPGGLMICDDYLGGEWTNPLDQPKMAIDAFINCNMKRLRVLPVSGYQIFIQKYDMAACNICSDYVM